MKNSKSKFLIFALLSVAIILSTMFASAFASQAPVNFGNANNFTIFAESGITSIPTSIITGNIGVHPSAGTAMVVSCPEVVSGIIYVTSAGGSTLGCQTVNSTLLNLAKTDNLAAYNNATGRAADATNIINVAAGEIGGLTFAPGVYAYTGASINVLISTDVTLSGGANDVWIFQIPGTLTVSSGKQVKLIGGAQAKNVFWAVAGATQLGTTSVFNGNILEAGSKIEILTHATLNGRALSQFAVTLDQNTVTMPPSLSPPTLSNFSTGSITTTSAVVSWNSDVSADSFVNYGINSSLGKNVSDSTLVKNHSISLTGLSSLTYFYTVKSCNAGGCVTGPIQTFNTATQPAPAAPGSGGAAPSGGGGGGGGGYYCATQWTCTDYSTCVSGTQTRTCSYPSNFCAPRLVKPTESQVCTTTPGTPTATPSAGTPTANPTTKPTPSTPGITGGVIGALGSPTGIVVMILVALAIIGAALAMRYKPILLHKQ